MTSSTIMRSLIHFGGGVLLAVLLGACAGNPTINKAQRNGVQQFNSVVEYTDERNGPVPARFNPDELLLVFPYIPGQMYGQPSGDPLIVKHLKGKLDFQLDLRGKLDDIALFARPMPLQEQGIQVSPSATRMARIGTFAFDPQTLDMVGDGSFIDRQSREYLIMVYVDQPCQITGKVQMNGKVYDHKIKLAARGFHWLKFHKQGKQGFLLQQYSPKAGVNFTVTLPDLLNV